MLCEFGFGLSPCSWVDVSWVDGPWGRGLAGMGGDGSTVGLDGLGGLFQPQW